MKTTISLIVFISALFLASCQNANNIYILPYTVEKNVYSYEDQLFDFKDAHSTSLWANLQYYRIINDTAYEILMSQKKDTLFVLNLNNFNVRKIALTDMNGKEGGGIWSLYYHNHDSIFFFIDRYYLLYFAMKCDRKYSDIILLNKQGERINEYSLDSMPDVYDGTLYKKHYPWDQYISDRMFAGGILVDAIVKKPYVNEETSDGYNPKILGLYDLENKKIRMLNVKYPAELIGKKYDITPSLQIKKYNNKELIIAFSTLPYLYRYNYVKDTMIRIPANYDLHFLNVDSASMKKGTDYISAEYDELIWCPRYSFYCRNIRIMHCKGYIKGKIIVEALDSNFNHIGYISGNKNFAVGCSEEGVLYAFNKSTKTTYHLSLNGNKKRINKTKCLHSFMDKIPPTKKRALHMAQYLNLMQIPDSSVAIVINLKYPCGGCLEHLLNFYKTHQSTLESNRIFYIFYDPEKTRLAQELIRRYKITNAKNILEDNKLLHRVSSVIPGKEYQNVQYLYVEQNFRNGKCILAEYTFEQLTTMLNNLIK